MAGETLKNVSDLLADYADNQAGLIGAIEGRDFIVSSTVSVGFVEDDPAQVPFTIPMSDGVPVDFMSELIAPGFFGNFWKLDGNNAIVESYTDLGVNIPAATFRLVGGSILLDCQKDGNATEVTYEFQGTEGGVFTGSPITRDISNESFLVATGGDRILDMSIAGPLSFSITPIGHSSDLQVNDVRVSVQGVML